MLTTHPNSILNPDVVADWVAQDNLTQSQCQDKADRGQALLGNVRTGDPEYPRAAKAVELWRNASTCNPLTLHSPMTLSNIWTDDNKLRAVFSWLTRIGAAPKFGTLPIAYYQADQVKAIEAIEAALKYHGLPEYSKLRTKGGSIEAQAGPGAPWQRIALMTCGTITTVPKRQSWSNAECGE